MRNSDNRRNAFTLVELMMTLLAMSVVVISVILFYPKRESRLAMDGADRLQTYLTQTRGRAAREMAPNGIRLRSSDGGATYESIEFISEGSNRVVPIEPSSRPGQTLLPASQWTIYLDMPGGSPVLTQYGVSLWDEGVKAGDILEVVSGTVEPHRIESINYASNQITLAAKIDPATGEYLNLPGPNCVASAKLIDNYRYVKQAGPLMGEPSVPLPEGCVILGETVSAPGSRHLPKNRNGDVDILFGPAGPIVSGDRRKIILWVTDRENKAKPALVVIYPQTGAVSVREVGPVGDEYQFTRDAGPGL